MTRREGFKPFDVTEYLGAPQDRAAYLRAMWEDTEGDPAMIAVALGDVARAIGMSQIARETGIAREALYKSLSERGNPELATLVKVLRVLGLELSVRTRRAESAKAESPEDELLDAISGRQRKPVIGVATSAPKKVPIKRRSSSTERKSVAGAIVARSRRAAASASGKATAAKSLAARNRKR